MVISRNQDLDIIKYWKFTEEYTNFNAIIAKEFLKVNNGYTR